jgi:hypothetical protein
MLIRMERLPFFLLPGPGRCLALLLCLLPGLRAVGQDRPVQAEYLLVVNLSAQEAIDSTDGISLAPAGMTQLVQVYADEPGGIRSVTLGYSTDGIRWHLLQSSLLTYPYPNEPTLGVCSLGLTEEQAQYLQENPSAYIQMSFFNHRRLLCQEITQKGAPVLDVCSAKKYKLDKGLQTRLAKIRAEVRMLVDASPVRRAGTAQSLSKSK